MMDDRTDDNLLRITQTLLAEMLGVQRPTITNAVREFEKAGLIAPGQRQIAVLDRQSLLQMLPDGLQADRFSPSKNIPVRSGRNFATGNLHYRQACNVGP